MGLRALGFQGFRVLGFWGTSLGFWGLGLRSYISNVWGGIKGSSSFTSFLGTIMPIIVTSFRKNGDMYCWIFFVRGIHCFGNEYLDVVHRSSFFIWIEIFMEIFRHREDFDKIDL